MQAEIMLGVSARVLACVIAAALLLTSCRSNPQEEYTKYLQRGKSELQNHSYRRAAIEFQNAIKFSPKSAEARYNLALAYIGVHAPQAAVAALWKALQLDPNYSQAELKLSELALGTRNRAEVEAAEQRVRRLLEKSPANAEALDVLARAEWRLGKSEQAENTYLQASAKFPRDLRIAISFASLKIAKKDFATADKILRKVASENPMLPEAAVTLGEFYMRTARLEDAGREFRRALTLDSKNGQALVWLGELQWRLGNTEEADGLFKQAAALPDPQYAPVHAIFLFRTGKRDQAIIEFEALAKRSPADREARDRLVEAYKAANRSSDAEKLLSAALQKNRKDVDALLERSHMSLQAGNYNEAIADLMTVVRYRPESGRAHHLLARAYQKSGAARRYREELTEAVKLQPDLLAARAELAEHLISANSPGTALNVLNQAPEAQKRELPILIERNWAYLGAGQWAEARNGIDDLLKTGNVPEAFVQDGTFKLTHRKFAAARAAFEKALTKNPDDYKTLHLLLQTYEYEKELPAGIERIRKQAAERPNSAPVQFLFGQVMAKTGNRSEARKAFAAAKSADPALTDADVALATLDVEDGNLDSGRKRMTDLLARAPGDIRAHLLLGSIAERAKNRPTAVEQYRAVVQVDSSNLQALNELAKLLVESEPRYHDEALKFAQKAKELAPDDPTTADTLGWVLYRKTLYSSAVPQFESAVSKAPTGLHKLHLGMAYVKAGDLRKGQQMLASALADPAVSQSEAFSEARVLFAAR